MITSFRMLMGASCSSNRATADAWPETEASINAVHIYMQDVKKFDACEQLKGLLHSPVIVHRGHIQIMH